MANFLISNIYSEAAKKASLVAIFFLEIVFLLVAATLKKELFLRLSLIICKLVELAQNMVLTLDGNYKTVALL